MPSKNYIPDPDVKFEPWFKYLTVYVVENTTGSPPKWTHIPQSEVDKLNTVYINWNTAYTAALGPHTSVQTEAKNNAKKAAKSVIRPFVNQYLRFPPVSVEDRTAMSIPNRDVKPTPIHAPTSQAEADLTFPGVHIVELVKIRKVGSLSDDPRSDYGVRVYYGIVDATNEKWRIPAPPVTGDNLYHSVFTREKKQLFDFDGESGKTLYICLRYETSRGLPGPFGPILHAVIP
jgi:hypothetical protein